MLGTCTVAEEIAYHSSSLAGVYDGQCILVPQTLQFAGPELRARLIPELVSGRVAFSFATTEPETSSDLTAERLRTVADETADGFVVNGRKRWITNCVVAGWVSVLVRAGADSNRATMLLVDLSSPGVRIGTPDIKMGHRGQITADIVFDDVRGAAGEPARKCGWRNVGCVVCTGAGPNRYRRRRGRRRSGGTRPCGPSASDPGGLRWPARRHAALAVRHGSARDRDRVCPHALSEGSHSDRSRRSQCRAGGSDGQGVRHQIGQ